jgi:tRNA-splicing ligase RtcB
MLPIKYHLSPDLMPDTPTKLQLKNAAREKDAFHHIAVMPDVHPKKGRKCPTGTVLASKKYIFPQVMDTAPNCGMRLFTTPWNKDNFSKEKIDQLFQALVKVVPTRTYFGSWINYKTALGVARFGSKALLDYWGIKDKQELEMIFKNGNFFKTPLSKEEILNAIPKIFLRIAQFRLGILGEAGNHFLDLMRIDDVLDEEKAKLLSLKKDQYVFLLHTGSGVFGQYSSYFFTPKKEEHLSMKIITNLGRMTFSSQLLTKKRIKKLQKKVKEYREKTEFFKIDPNTKKGKAYLIAHRASANYGFANRTMIMRNIQKTAEKLFNPKANQEKLDFKMVCDVPHIFVDKEKHFNREVWVHRNGASRGFGPSRMKGHPVYSKTGEPGILAGSMSTPTYLVTGMDENESTFYSINHGAGRTRKISDQAPETKEELMKTMKESKVKLYNAKSKGVVQQASKYYKDIDEILKINQNFKISKPVAKMMPVSVLMA